MDIVDFRDLWVRPALRHLGKGIADERLKMVVSSLAAERLMLGTAVTESGLRHLRQRTNTGFGPALSFFQIESATFDDVMRYVRRRAHFHDRLSELVPWVEPTFQDLAPYPMLAVCVARLKYWMRPEPLPAASETRALAVVWKVVFNTELGKGRIQDFIDHMNNVVLPTEKE